MTRQDIPFVEQILHGLSSQVVSDGAHEAFAGLGAKLFESQALAKCARTYITEIFLCKAIKQHHDGGDEEQMASAIKVMARELSFLQKDNPLKLYETDISKCLLEKSKQIVS